MAIIYLRNRVIREMPQKEAERVAAAWLEAKTAWPQSIRREKMAMVVDHADGPFELNEIGKIEYSYEQPRILLTEKAVADHETEHKRIRAMTPEARAKMMLDGWLTISVYRLRPMYLQKQDGSLAIIEPHRTHMMGKLVDFYRANPDAITPPKETADVEILCPIQCPTRSNRTSPSGRKSARAASK